ncbi:hypothetical protein C5S21_07890 [Clostridium perfringens]
MNWEEELVLRNRKVKFDKNLVGKTMCNIVGKIESYANKYRINLNPSCIPLEHLDIDGENAVRVNFNFLEKDTILNISVENGEHVFASILIEDYFYTIKYENLREEDQANYQDVSYYDLSEEILSETIKNVLILNNKF